MKLFVRQSFTQADKSQQKTIQKILDMIKRDFQDIILLTGKKAEKSDSFQNCFEKTTGTRFAPKAFRKYRLSLIDQCDAFLFIRTSMSESGSFELSYNLHSNTPKPVFYAHWSKAPIKTTLLRELGDDYPVVYSEFKKAKDIQPDFRNFVNGYKLWRNPS